jgi:hypothetical protein
MEQSRLSVVFRCLGLGFPGGCETKDGSVVIDGISTGHATHKSVLMAAVEVISHHLTSFTEVTNILVATGSAEGLCKWLQFLDTYCRGVFGPREHLVLLEGDAFWFLKVQGFRAAVALARTDLRVLQSECGTTQIEILTDCIRNVRPQVQTMTAYTWMAALASVAASYGEKAHRWWVAGDEDREVDDDMWTHATWLAEVRAVLLTAASDIVSWGGDLFSMLAFPSPRRFEQLRAVIGMIKSLDVVAAGVRPKTIKKQDEDSTDDVGYCYGRPVEPAVKEETCMSMKSAGFVLLDDSRTGLIVERMLGLYLAAQPEGGLRRTNMHTVLPVLAAYVARGRVMGDEIVFREVSRAGGVLDSLRDHADRVNDIMLEHVIWRSWFEAPDSASRSRARLWWGDLSLPLEVSDVVRSAVGSWHSFLLDMIRRHFVDMVKRITTWNNEFQTGARDEDDDPEYFFKQCTVHWRSLQADAKMLVEVTGRVQELQDGFRAALDIAPHAGEFISTFGPPEDFMQFCDALKRWTDPRREWIAAVFRGGAAMRARKVAVAAAPPAARRSKRTKK